MSIVKFKSVTKTYKDVSIKNLFRRKVTLGVDKLSFEINEGETFGLLGLNGAGKTTTLKLMLGLLKPDSGSVELFGKHPSSDNLLAKIGYLPEVSYLFKNLTASETLDFLSRLSGIKPSEESIKKTLEIVGLDVPRSKKAAKFSKGMMQRLAVAQSLIHNPELLIYDEPTSGLDPLGIKEMRSLIEGLKKSGKTIILSSHYISEVEKLCDRVGILVNGSLVRMVESVEFSKPGALEEIFLKTVL